MADDFLLFDKLLAQPKSKVFESKSIRKIKFRGVSDTIVCSKEDSGKNADSGKFTLNAVEALSRSRRNEEIEVEAKRRMILFSKKANTHFSNIKKVRHLLREAGEYESIPDETLDPSTLRKVFDVPNHYDHILLPEVADNYPFLRPYQHRGVQWMFQKYQRGDLGLILGDDMGMGKTAQVCCFLHLINDPKFCKFAAPSIVVAPNVTLANWMRELARWSPTLKVVKYHGSKDHRKQMRSSSFIGQGEYDVMLTTATVLCNDKPYFIDKIHWRCVVVDEAHSIKTSSSQITQTCRKITSPFRVALTGTPVQNHMRELWCLAAFLHCSLLQEDLVISDSTEYETSVEATGVEAYGLSESVSDFLSCFMPYVMLRRTKSETLRDLPRKRIQTVFLEPTPEQRLLCHKICSDAVQRKEITSSYMHLRKVACHPYLIDLLYSGKSQLCSPLHDNSVSFSSLSSNIPNESLPTDDSAHMRLHRAGVPAFNLDTLSSPSAKLLKLEALLPSLRDEGHRVVIFSSFRTMLDLVEVLCVLRSYPYCRLDGLTPYSRRDLDMQVFNRPHSSIFAYLVTTTTGGVGISLVGADTAILLDPHFNPTVDEQAIDRIHRLGQTRDVQVYRFLLQDSVEERINVVSSDKSRLGSEVLRDGVEHGVERSSYCASIEDLEAMGCKNARKEISSEVLRCVDKWMQKLRSQSGEFDLELNLSESVQDDTGLMEQGIGEMVDDTDGRVIGSKKLRLNCGSLTSRNAFRYSSTCFICHEYVSPCDALPCNYCPKNYHLSCIEEIQTVRKPFSCPRHFCHVCQKSCPASGGVLFLCISCTHSYCFEHLSPSQCESQDSSAHSTRTSKQDDGFCFLPDTRISNTYPERISENVPLRNSLLYIRCTECRAEDIF